MSAMGNSRFKRIMDREKQRERQAEEERRHQEEKRALEWQLWHSQYQYHVATASWHGMAPGRACPFITFFHAKHHSQNVPVLFHFDLF